MLTASAFALSMQAQGNYTVNGSLSNAEGQKAYIITSARSIDSTIVKNGKQEELNRIDEEMKPFTEPLEALNNKLRDGANRDSITALMEPYQKQYKEYSTNFYKQRTKSYFATKYLMLDMGHMNYEELKPIWDSLDTDVQKYGVSAEEIAQELSALEKVRPGCPAPDFTANDINGKPFTLSSLRGKLVIIDFWASWCVPCRKSNPHMRELYAKYHDRGLDMVYVSDDDRNPDAWKKAVEKDMLTGEGYHHVLRGLKWDRSKGMNGFDRTNDISDKYAIHYLPTKYLIDRKGNIVCKINEGEDEELNRQIEKLLAE